MNVLYLFILRGVLKITCRFEGQEGGTKEEKEKEGDQLRDSGGAWPPHLCDRDPLTKSTTNQTMCF